MVNKLKGQNMVKLSEEKNYKQNIRIIVISNSP